MGEPFWRDGETCIDLDRHSVAALPNDPVPAEELDGAIAGPVDPDLPTWHESEAILEADLRAGVETEEIFRQLAEAPLAQVT